MGYGNWKHSSLAQLDLHQMNLYLEQLTWCIPDLEERTETESDFYYSVLTMQERLQKLFEENGEPKI